jgi:hypothetical protein
MKCPQSTLPATAIEIDEGSRSFPFANSRATEPMPTHVAAGAPTSVADCAADSGVDGKSCCNFKVSTLHEDDTAVSTALGSPLGNPPQIGPHPHTAPPLVGTIAPVLPPAWQIRGRWRSPGFREIAASRDLDTFVNGHFVLPSVTCRAAR